MGGGSFMGRVYLKVSKNVHYFPWKTAVNNLTEIGFLYVPSPLFARLPLKLNGKVTDGFWKQTPP